MFCIEKKTEHIPRKMLKEKKPHGSSIATIDFGLFSNLPARD